MANKPGVKRTRRHRKMSRAERRRYKDELLLRLRLGQQPGKREDLRDVLVSCGSAPEKCEPIVVWRTNRE